MSKEYIKYIDRVLIKNKDELTEKESHDLLKYEEKEWQLKINRIRDKNMKEAAYEILKIVKEKEAELKKLNQYLEDNFNNFEINFDLLLNKVDKLEIEIFKLKGKIGAINYVE